MPELPEVEVVRLGLAPVITDAVVLGVDVLDERALTRHTGGAADFVARLEGATLAEPRRRGKFLWAPLASPLPVPSPLPEPARSPPPEPARSPPPEPVEGRSEPVSSALPEPVEGSHAHARPPASTPAALLAHLGMSGQLLVRDPAAGDDRHARIRMRFDGPRGRYDVVFVDQRTFGSLALDALVPADWPSATPRNAGGPTTGAGSRDESEASRPELIPSQVAHIARDPLDSAFDDEGFVARLRRRRSPVKSALLDQTLVAGIGNIYADEALWRARLHPARQATTLTARRARELLGHVRDVFAQALVEGGTSFDALYVDVNGEAGYFAHSLNAYGRDGLPCLRCGVRMRREPFQNRSSHFCPRCQRER